MPVTLPLNLPPTRSGRTFFLAAAALGALAGLQLVAFGVHLVQAGRKHGTPPVVITAPEVALPAIAAAPPAASPTMPAPTESAGAQLAPGPSIARPTPAVTQRDPSNPNDLLDQARQLRQSGDTNTALARLRDAQAIAPDSPMLIAETALTYEAMGLNDRAFEQWQRLYDQGETIGALYYMAEARIHHVPSSAAAASGAATGHPPDADDGFQENSVLKIVNLALEEQSDPDAEKKLALKISVKNKPGFMVDPRRVKIEARFYDLLDGKDVVITNAVTGFAWLTAPVNWANDQTEILETTYLRPKVDPAAQAPAPPPAATPAAKSARRGRHSRNAEEAASPASPTPPPAPNPVRTYLGFSVCLYYNGQLQDQQATPVRLLQQFPPPLTLTSE